MALQKDKQLGNTGVIGNYCRIEKLNINVSGLEVEVLMGIYLNIEVRNSGSSPIMFERVILDDHARVAAMFQSLANGSISMYGNVATLCYNEIKLLPEWSDAVDV